MTADERAREALEWAGGTIKVSELSHYFELDRQELVEKIVLSIQEMAHKMAYTSTKDADIIRNVWIAIERQYGDKK